MRTDQSTFPSAPQAAGLLLAQFLFEYLLGSALHDLRGLLGLTGAQITVLVMLLANAVLITAVMHIRGMSHRSLIHPAPTAPLLTLMFLVPPVLLLVPFLVLSDVVLMNALEAILPVSSWEQQTLSSMLAPTLPTFLATCLIAPVVEEMLFRGILLRAFLTRYPRGIAIGYSALYFGVAHLNIYQFLLAFLLGLLLGWLYERSHSLIPGMALHAGLNSSVMLLDMSSTATASQEPLAIPLPVWFAAAVAAALGCLILRRLLGLRLARR